MCRPSSESQLLQSATRAQVDSVEYPGLPEHRESVDSVVTQVSLGLVEQAVPVELQVRVVSVARAASAARILELPEQAGPVEQVDSVEHRGLLELQAPVEHQAQVELVEHQEPQGSLAQVDSVERLDSQEPLAQVASLVPTMQSFKQLAAMKQRH